MVHARLALALAVVLGAQSVHAGGVQVRQQGRTVSLSNGLVRLRFDLGSGTISVVAANGLGLSGAQCRLGAWGMGRPGVRRTWSAHQVTDALGRGKALRVVGEQPGAPDLVFESVLYDGSGLIALGAGTRNSRVHPIRIKSYQPLTDARLTFQGAMTRARTLDGLSGALQSEVLDGPYRTSNNNLLLTFCDGGRRRSLVMGGLTYHEMTKTASLAPALSGTRRQQLAARGQIAGYVDSGEATEDRHLALLKGTSYTFPGDPATPWFNTIVFDSKEIVYGASGLDPSQVYTLGLSWWDENNDGRRQSVWVEPGDGSPRVRLIPSTRLPAWEGRRQRPEEREVPIPPLAYQTGRCRIVVTNDAQVPNAVLSEIWLWRGPVSHAKAKARLPRAIYASVSASDPVGRLVEPGETWIPDDRFYLDLTTSDPFAALERYGQALKLAQRCHPNPYDFPTVCAWYAGVWKTPGAQNHPSASRYKIATTPGLVDEAGRMKASGFLRYSRAAARLVPDNYTANNPQGWWDDAHWQKEGFYVAPYETSQKWGKAMQAVGPLAFTYFQPSGPLHSLDFRESHRQMLLEEDVKRNLDFSKPATQAYMRGVFAAMRGAISGMMFDYCDELWVKEASGGGFWDRHMTATAYYRTVLQLAKDGLGPNSWIHERALWQPGHDIALGISDSQRTSGDTDKIDPAMLSRSGLRWYKNRQVLAYDMDSKEMFSSWKVPGFTGTDQDGRRMMLTMAYVAASRLLLANSFREMPPEVLRDLERTFPYPSKPKSARPIDAFAHKGWPRVYDDAVSRGWHQLTLFNGELPTRERVFTVPLARPAVESGLGLSPSKWYHVYDFWKDRYVGALPGTAGLEQRLRPGEARMLSIRENLGRPQVVSTNRHITQGLLDLVDEPKWDAKSLTLSGRSRVVGGDDYRISIVTGRRYGPALSARAPGAKCSVKTSGRVAVLSIATGQSSMIRWQVRFAKRSPR